MTDSNMTMPVAPLYNGGNGGFGWGGDIWLILIVLFACGGFGGGFGNAMLGYDFPWLLNGQQGINANTNAGFNQAATQSALGDINTAITSGFGNVQTALCGGFAGVNASVNGAQNAIAQQLYTNQIADLERSYNAQTASTQGMNAIQAQLAQCCCDNRAATQDVKFTLAQEACATRQNSTDNTKAILDKLCQLELDGYKRENDQLRSQLQFANLQASQVDQTAQLRTSQATVANQLVSELRSCPIPAQPVYGNTPIFTQSTSGCGCGNF